MKSPQTVTSQQQPLLYNSHISNATVMSAHNTVSIAPDKNV